MKTLQAYCGASVLIDDEDFHWLSKFNWHVTADGYVSTELASNKRNTGIRIHQLLLGGKSPLVDHKDGNTLNNQKENLRPCGQMENGQNRRVQKHSSRFKGVSWIINIWVASIRVNKNKMHLGRFDSEVDAAIAYDSAAERYFGKFARTNKMMGLI
jgi:hypothetical protein